MNVLMVGVDASTGGGMWTVAQQYLSSKAFSDRNHLIYVPTFRVGDPLGKLCFMARGFWRIRCIFHRQSVDVVHVHMSERASVYRKGLVMRYARRHGARVLLHMHGAELEDWYRSLSPRRQKTVGRIVDQADAVVILGDYWRDFLSELVSVPEKIHVVHNAVPIPDRAAFREDARTLLFLGAVSRRKGIYDLLDAMQLLKDRLPEDWKLEIYGPDVIGTIREEIERRELGDRVRYGGRLEPRDRDRVLARTGLNLLPSWNEGLPMTILETMAGGIPSVTTAIAAIPEAVNAENGILLAPGDVEGLARSIEMLCRDPRTRCRMSEACRRTAAEKFSLEGHLAAIERIYEEMVDA